MKRIARWMVFVVLTVVGTFKGNNSACADTPDGREIADVIVQGNAIRTTQQILSQMATRPGKRFSQVMATEDVGRLNKQGWFRPDGIKLDTEILANGNVVVYVRVHELSSSVQDIIYRGADHIGREELDKLTDLKKGRPMSPSFNQSARQNILRHYHEKGRYWASVRLVEGNKIEDSRVVFDIAEGPVVKIHSISFNFVGEHKSDITEGRLKTQLSSGSSILGLLGGDFNVVQLEMDVIKLQEYYQGLGYLKARVQRELIFTKDLRGVDVIFHIEEGIRHRVEELDIKPNKPSRKPEDLMKWTDVRPGEFYNSKLVAGDQERIKRAIGYEGIPAVVNPNVIDLGEGRVKVEYPVNERDRTRVGAIDISGNTVTKQNVILRQMGLFPGQLLSYPELVEAERRLSRLGIFEEDPQTGVKPTVEVVNPEIDAPFKNLLVQVKEKPTGSFMVGAGVNSDAGLTGSIVINEKNFDIWRVPTSWDDIWQGKAWRGAGQEFRIELVPGTYLQRYTVSFREPYLFDSMYSMGLSGYFYQRSYLEYNEDRTGGRLTFGRRIDNNWSLNLTTRVEDVNLSNVPIDAPPEIANYNGHSTLVGVRPSITWDTRDNYLRATSGHTAEIGYEQVTGTYTFPLITAEATKYFTTWERVDGSGKHVLAVRSQLSYAGSNAPVFERFFAGGFRSMRGFSFRGVGPEVNGYFVGGDFAFLNSIEYQIPVMANDNLYVVGFVDHGTVEQSVSIKDYRVTAGVGLRIAVPQLLGPVPLALDFGFPLNQAPQDHKQLFSFWLGFFN